MQSLNGQRYKVVKYGKYELTGLLLGKGNYSKVKEAVDCEKQNRVALKIVDLVNAKDNYIRQNYKREACLLAKLKHPNIIRLRDVIETPSWYVMVLDLMPETLCDFIRRQHRGRLEESMGRMIFRQMASGISFIHSQGVVHRDIKLENILYDKILQQVKITDFGLSNIWDKKSLLKTNCGSPEYSAPELHAGRHYDCAVDVWALGVCLFAMIVGRLPFDVDRKKPVNNLSRREMFLEETKFGTRTPRLMDLMAKNSVCYKDLVSLMLNPDEKKRIKMVEVEKHNWLVISRTDYEAISINRLQEMSAKKKSATKPKEPTARPETARDKTRPEYLGTYRVFVPSQPNYNAQRPKTDKKDFNNLKSHPMYRNPLPDQFIFKQVNSRHSNARADKS